jgi:mannose-6-phosphate isomerase-like protein (cupin superfamily)
LKLRSIDGAEPFTTKDGSTIRELHHTQAQSLAEATLEPDQATQRHFHRRSEEIYFVTKGSGSPGAWHTLENDGTSELTILCVCSPPYSHEDTFFE